MGDHKSRIAPGVRTVSWTETARVAIGHHECMWCRVETPSPTDAQVIEFAQDNRGVSTMWPFEHWRPAGWTQADSTPLCPECSATKAGAMEQARKARRP